MTHQPQPSAKRQFDAWAMAFIFDLDGVITDTAEVHNRAWKEMFDRYLETRAKRLGVPFVPFDRETDYHRYVDGKPRYDGVRDFLSSRGIELQTGSPGDPPDRETICGLGNRKNMIFRDVIDNVGVSVFPAAVKLIDRLRSRNIKIAVVSSSKNCRQILEKADIVDLFDVMVDGVRSAELGLQGKPAPDIFLLAAEELAVSPDRAVVVEDAIAGVEAGRRGGFGYVIGVDHKGRGQIMMDHGADWIVNDIAEIDQAVPVRQRNSDVLPSALDRIDEIACRRDGRQPVVFLDYDGTLSPIVDRPEEAALAPGMQKALTALAGRCTVAIVSGRGLADVRERVNLDTLYYAGSHGFEIDGPGQEHLLNDKGVEALPALDQSQSQLERQLADIEGALVERKKFSIAVHYRKVAAEQIEKLERIVDNVLGEHPELRKGHGKKVFELQPDIAWDKGRAVLWLMKNLELDGDTIQPIYIGDDVTDEDAFRVLRGLGAGILVHDGAARQTLAEYRLETPQAVRVFLEKLATLLSGVM